MHLSQLPADPSQPATPATLDSQAELTHQPHDKYVTPEMNSSRQFIASDTTCWLPSKVSGIYGFEMLHMLEIKIDYRDGLVAFKFDSNRYH
jgi:hypothetical protein